jgi:hypothetical protein
VANLLQLKLGSACDIKKQISWTFHVGDRSESSSTYDMIIGQDLLGESGIIMNFNDQNGHLGYAQHATKILDAEYKQTSAILDDVIKTFKNLHVEEQHQLYQKI